MSGVGSICCVCGFQKDCRPYGQNGTAICFECMEATPGGEAEAKRQIKKAFDKIDAAGGVPAITKKGVRPLEQSDLGGPLVVIKRGGSR
jgi:hypothetical protein